MLKKFLDSEKCFKLVCGAGNEDAQEVEKLVKLYSVAGCKFFDLSAKPEIVDAAKRGLEDRQGFLCVSVGIKGDPHIQKAKIDTQKCNLCGMCKKNCPQNAIIKEDFYKVIPTKCIGCEKCNCEAISYYSQNKDLKEVLPPLVEKGIDCIEFHVMGEGEIIEKWNYINSIYDGMLSICTSRGLLSEQKMLERIKLMIDGREDFSTIVQADGFPMSGGCDDYKTTLQAVSTAEIVQNANLPVYIMLSGGTNSKTTELAQMCGINYNGVAIGTFARKIVSKYIDREDFLQNEQVFNKALEIAQKLVQTV